MNRFRKSSFPKTENIIFYLILISEAIYIYRFGAVFQKSDNFWITFAGFVAGFSINILASVYFLKIIFHYNRIPHQMRDLFPVIFVSFQCFFIILLLNYYHLIPQKLFVIVFLPISLIHFISYIPTLLILKFNYNLSYYRSFIYIIGLILLKFFMVVPFIGMKF